MKIHFYHIVVWNYKALWIVPLYFWSEDSSILFACPNHWHGLIYGSTLVMKYSVNNSHILEHLLTKYQQMVQHWSLTSRSTRRDQCSYCLKESGWTNIGTDTARRIMLQHQDYNPNYHPSGFPVFQGAKWHVESQSLISNDTSRSAQGRLQR